MKIRILGAGQEVGKSAILVKDQKNIVMDYGVKLHGEQPEYPISDEKIDSCVISHAHLDHSGATPYIHRKGGKIYMTDVTKDLVEILLNDSLKIAKQEGFAIPFNRFDVNSMLNKIRIEEYNKSFKVENMKCTLFNSGHIPGSAGILLSGKKSIYYTGDIYTQKSNLVKGAKIPKNCDVMVTESTYGNKNHPNREKEEKLFIKTIEEGLQNQGTILLPVLSVGRCQEILLMLKDYADKICIDGMSQKTTKVISKYPKYINDPHNMKNLLKKIFWIKDNRQRQKVVEKNPIILSSSGMLGGGPSVRYLREIKSNPESMVLLTSFQANDSPGKGVLENKIFEDKNEKFKVKCFVKQFDFSSHSEGSEIMKIIKDTNPEKVICVHGDECEKFARNIEKEFPGIQAFAPKNGDEIEI